MLRKLGTKRCHSRLIRCAQSRTSLREASTSSSEVGSHENYDVVVVGGGPAGLALVNALLSQRSLRETLKIALVEAGDLSKVRSWTSDHDSFSNRASSITNTSRSFLTDIGVWRYVDESRTGSVQEMQVWDGISDSRIKFSATDMSFHTHVEKSSEGDHEMARMTENLNLQRALMQNLVHEKTEVLQIMDNTKVNAIEKENGESGGWPLVHTSDGRTLRARLLVGADGINSPVRLYSGIESFGWPYDTRAIVATLSHAPRRVGLDISNTTAFQRFLPTGPIAFLPFTPTKSTLVWSTKPALAVALMSADPSVLTMMINAAFRLPSLSMQYLHHVILENGMISVAELKNEIEFRERSHAIEPHSAYSSLDVESSSVGIPPEGAEALPPLVTSIQTGSIASFPLRLNHADSYIGDTEQSFRTVLLGDAAHTIHPLAGQGLNMGLGDAQSLASCIHQTILSGGDIGSYTALLPYAKSRYFENHKLLSAVDKLHKLYSSKSTPVVWARSIGLEVLNELDSVKAAIMMSAGADVAPYRTYGPHSGTGSRISPLADVAAKGTQLLAGGIDAARTVGKGLGILAASGLRQLADSFEKK